LLDDHFPKKMLMFGNPVGSVTFSHSKMDVDDPVT